MRVCNGKHVPLGKYVHVYNTYVLGLEKLSKDTENIQKWKLAVIFVNTFSLYRLLDVTRYLPMFVTFSVLRFTLPTRSK